MDLIGYDRQDVKFENYHSSIILLGLRIDLQAIIMGPRPNYSYTDELVPTDQQLYS